MKRFTIRQLLLGLATLPVLAVAALLGSYLIYQYLDELERQLAQRAAASSRLLALHTDAALNQERGDDLQVLVDSVLEEPGVRSVRIIDRDGRVLARAGAELPDATKRPRDGMAIHDAESTYRVARPVYSNSSVSGQVATPRAPEIRGWVEMAYTRHAYTVSKYQALLVGSTAVLLAALLATALASLASRRIVLDINDLRAGAQAVAHGFRDTHFHIGSKGELRLLADDLNAMTTTVRKTLCELQDNIEQSHLDLRETMETLEVQNIELDLARCGAVEANRIKSEFLANTSHEIRTPLNGIIGFTNILLQSETDPRKRESLDIVRSSAQNLLTIINDLLDFSKLESGKLILDKAPLSFREAVEEVIGILGPSAHEKNLELALFMDPRIPDAMIGDSLRIKQVLTNLIGNSIKFTTEGLVRVDVRVTETDARQVSLAVEISDTGIGLTSEQQSRIFKAFAQADASTSRRYGGTGLGLVIVKRLVEQMGGEVGVESDGSSGALFWFTVTLPVVENAVPARPFRQLAGRRIAIYDGRPTSRAALEQLLRGWGVETLSFATSKALFADGSNADLMILGLDAREAAVLPDALRQCRLPVIILSPTLEGVEPQEHYRCLSQPPSQIRLFDAVAEVLNRYGEHRPLPRPSPPGPHHRRRVLAVDDNPANLRVLEVLLEDQGFEAATANSGAQAIEACLQGSFDAVFLDLQMPGMDGVETAQRIRQLPAGSRLPLIALSACAAPDDPAALREAGFHAYCSKPLNPQQIDMLLERIAAGTEPLIDSAADETGSASAHRAPVDIAQSVRLAGGKAAVARDLLRMLIDDLPTTRDTLREAHRSAEWQTLREINHRLRGACSYVGVPELREATECLEQQLAEGIDADIDGTLDRLITALDGLDVWQREHDIATLFEEEASEL